MASTARRHAIREMMRKRVKGEETDEQLVELVHAEIAAIHSTQQHLVDLESKLLSSIMTVAASHRHRSKTLCAAASFNRFSMKTPNKTALTKYVQQQPQIANALSTSHIRAVHGR